MSHVVGEIIYVTFSSNNRFRLISYVAREIFTIKTQEKKIFGVTFLLNNRFRSCQTKNALED